MSSLVKAREERVRRSRSEGSYLGYIGFFFVLSDISKITSKSAPTIPKLHRRWNVFPPLASDGLILVIWRSSEAHSDNFVVIHTHPSRRFYLAVKFLGLRRNGSSSQIINQAQDFSEQFPRHRDLGQLERDVPPVTDDLGTDLHQLFPQRAQRPFNVGYWL